MFVECLGLGTRKVLRECGAAGASAHDSGACGAGEDGRFGRGSSLSEASRELTTAPAQGPPQEPTIVPSQALLSRPGSPPPACPRDVDLLPAGVHLPGQAPPLYLGTRQRQVVPDKLRLEPWALSSLTTGILPRPLAHGVSGQPCGCVRGSLCPPWLRGQPWMELTPQPCVPHPSVGSRGPVGWRPPS